MHRPRSFRADVRGSIAPIFAIVAVPLITAVGLSVDFSSGSSTRSGMQSALDAATLTAATLSSTTSDADRRQKLADSYAANGGDGTATMTSFSIDADGTAHIAASASYSMPTSFMRIAAIKNVGINVASSVNKKPSLVQATFKLSGASGWWNKTMYLYGTPFGGTTPQKLMQINYVYNNFGDPKGYGTTTAYTIATDSKGKTTSTQVQQQVCTTKTVKNFNGAPAGSIQQTSGSTKYLTTCTTSPANGSGAVIDVSKMGTLYLQMNVPSGNPSNLYSNDATTSNRLYIGDPNVQNNLPIEVKAGTIVDIFTAVPCGQTSSQAWEDGGTNPPSPNYTNSDFAYSVTGKCDLNQRPSDSVLTQ